MTLHYRGMTVQLAEGDPRIDLVDFLLFRELPPPLPRPAVTVAEPAPPLPPPVEPAVEVPAAWHALWNELPDGARLLLCELSRRELTTPELEAALGVGPGETRGFSIAIGVNARKAGLPNPVQGKRLGRLKRRHYVAAEARPVVLELERRWIRLRSVLDEVRQ